MERNTNSPYLDLFKNWADVQSQYSMDMPEPDEVIVADYWYESYCGDSVVAGRVGEKYFINIGSHCSCYGLEDQWKPVWYESRELFIECLKREPIRHALLNEFIKDIEENRTDKFYKEKIADLNCRLEESDEKITDMKIEILELRTELESLRSRDFKAERDSSYKNSFWKEVHLEFMKLIHDCVRESTLNTYKNMAYNNVKERWGANSK